MTNGGLEKVAKGGGMDKGFAKLTWTVLVTGSVVDLNNRTDVIVENNDRLVMGLWD